MNSPDEEQSSDLACLLSLHKVKYLPKDRTVLPHLGYFFFFQHSIWFSESDLDPYPGKIQGINTFSPSYCYDLETGFEGKARCGHCFSAGGHKQCS